MDANITGLTSDSRQVKKGFAFVAIKGLTHNGNDFINEAKRNGAIKIYKDSTPEELGKLASEFYDAPSDKIKVIGVTGTKGKTTTCHLIHHLLTSLGQKTGLISTITADGFHTTSLGVVELNQKLSEMVKKGYKYAVIEVSSHGIAQGRIAGINFEVGVLTNIAPEHLDYHKTFKEYKRVKMGFLKSCKIQVVSNKKPNTNCLKGDFNNINADTALKVIYDLGFTNYEENKKLLKTFELPQGRLEEIPNKLGAKIYIDFAHTPDSLEVALKYLRTVTKGLPAGRQGKLISVFGCASERDHKKRRKMGKISGWLADTSIFTAEDPRSENITDIFYAMKKDYKDAICIPERGEAIAYAVSIAKKGDVIGIFGKGHDKSMAYKGFEHPWSDRGAIENYLNSDNSVSAIILAAGKGSRMKSARPKVIHEICGRPIIAYTLENLRKAGISDICAVVSFKKNLVIRKIKGAVKIAYQKNPKGGTADAAKAGVDFISKDATEILIINGDDSAFYTPKTIQEIIKIHKTRERKLTFVSLMKDDPTGLGRVIRGKNGLITKIVEEKDATNMERKIKEVNDGLYLFDAKWFRDNINNVKKGQQGEYYLVDLIKI